MRVLIPDDDPATERRAKGAVAARFRRFDTSKLTLNVPAAGDVTIELSPR
ncbi:MAG: hypothetical protein ACRC33_02485 [Gemmataceae bacterium]